MIFKLLAALLAPFTSAQSGSFHPIDTFDEAAVVTSSIYPGNLGRVYFKATWWFACCPSNITLAPRTVVRVTARHNLTLVVEPSEADYTDSFDVSIFE